MERTFSIWSDRNVRDQLRTWSTLTGPVVSVGRTEMSPSILFDKIVVPSTALLYPAWVGAVQPECTAPLGTWNFRNFKPEFLLNGIMESAPSLHFRVAQPRRGRSVCHNQSINRSFNVNTWDGVAPIIRARSSCIKRMTIKILSQ